jgi:ribosomal protein L37E
MDDKFEMSFKTFLDLDSLGDSPILLYLFYAKTAKLTKSNSVYATNDYCKNNLRWGERKFSKAKKLLLDCGFIKEHKIRDKKNRFAGTEIEILR